MCQPAEWFDQFDTVPFCKISPRWPSGSGVRLEIYAPGFESSFRRGSFPRSSHTSGSIQLLPWQAPGTIGSELGLVGPVSVYGLRLRQKSLICSFYLSVAARTAVCADQSLRYTDMLLGREDFRDEVNSAELPSFCQSSLACQFLLVAQCIDKSTTNSVFLWYRSQRVCLFVGCLTSQQHASVSQGRICSDKFTCCHT